MWRVLVVFCIMCCSSMVSANEVDNEGVPLRPTSDLELILEEESGFALRLYLVASVPLEFGVYTYRAALEYHIDPWDLAAVLISEHSGGGKDFSIEGSFYNTRTMRYLPDQIGSAGEIGLFQVLPRWAPLAGQSKKDLYIPQETARIAAFVVKSNQDAHFKKCTKKKNNNHTWIAHYKCASRVRNDPKGRCRFKQDKWLYLRQSLRRIQSREKEVCYKRKKCKKPEILYWFPVFQVSTFF